MTNTGERGDWSEQAEIQPSWCYVLTVLNIYKTQEQHKGKTIMQATPDVYILWFRISPPMILARVIAIKRHNERHNNTLETPSSAPPPPTLQPRVLTLNVKYIAFGFVRVTTVPPSLTSRGIRSVCRTADKERHNWVCVFLDQARTPSEGVN